MSGRCDVCLRGEDELHAAGVPEGLICAECSTDDEFDELKQLREKVVRDEEMVRRDVENALEARHRAEFRLATDELHKIRLRAAELEAQLSQSSEDVVRLRTQVEEYEEALRLARSRERNAAVDHELRLVVAYVRLRARREAGRDAVQEVLRRIAGELEQDHVHRKAGG